MLKHDDAFSLAGNGRVSLTLQEMGECIFQTLEMGECITVNCQRSSQTILTTWSLKTFTATMRHGHGEWVSLRTDVEKANPNVCRE